MSSKSGNVQTGDRDDANGVQEFGDYVADKHSFRWLLAISYMAVTVTRHRNKLTYSDTLTILKRPAAVAESVFLQDPLLLGPILGQTGLVERKHLHKP